MAKVIKLIVKEAFGDYRRGDMITDAKVIQSILGTSKEANVIVKSIEVKPSPANTDSKKEDK